MAAVDVYRKSDGKFVELKIGHANLIYLDGMYPGGKQYKVSGGKIYCNGSKVHDNDDIREFMRQAGYIKWFGWGMKISSVFSLEKIIYLI